MAKSRIRLPRDRLHCNFEERLDVVESGPAAFGAWYLDSRRGSNSSMIDPAAFTWFPLFAVAWIVLAIAVSIAFRKKRGKPIFPKAPPEAVFSERGCSGRSLDTPWAKIGGARNCLLVALTPQNLTIVPIFPFNLIFLPEIYGLDHNLNISAIREVIDRKGLLGRHFTIIYADPELHRVELRLRHRDDFLQSLRKLGVSVTAA